MRIYGTPNVTSSSLIAFNRPFMTGKELEYIADAHRNAHLAGDGAFTRKCSQWLEKRLGVKKALLTQSCTAALEMCALLADIAPGDEIIMPSFTFVSTANAFVLRGGIPVFVDIRPDTLNIDETKIEAAITKRTRAIVVVHYAGVSCEMEPIKRIADRHELLLIEDAAQGILSHYRGRALGSIGNLATLSFHETKNIVSGEGGALLINDARFVERAEIIREKGTNRSHFLRGQVDKYTWVDHGSSFLPSELIAAFLWAQMEHADEITGRRKRIWETYGRALSQLGSIDGYRLPIVPENCVHNAHMFYVLTPNLEIRTRIIARLASEGINAVFHYVPLHSSPAGRRYGRHSGPLPFTDDLSGRLVRLPFWLGIEPHIEDIAARFVQLARDEAKRH